MKKIDTLVEDIYNLFSFDPIDMNEEEVDKHIDTFGEMLKVIGAMLIAGLLSYIMADPFVAIASVTAFIISEFADWGIYTWTKKPFAQRILISSIISTPLDSGIFLAMIGHFSILNTALMTIAKMIGAIVVWKLVNDRKV